MWDDELTLGNDSERVARRVGDGLVMRLFGHDLGEVTALHLMGWGNKNYLIQPRDDIGGVTLCVPMANPRDTWKFKKGEDGILLAFSELVEAPYRAPAGAPLVIQLPRSLADVLKIVITELAQ